MFFDDWEGLWRTAIVGTLAYVALVLILRVSGKRTLSKLNAFDFVVTVALGSTLATILLDSRTALAEGVLALALLIFLQFAITWLSARSSGFQALVKAEPSLLFHRGRFLHGALRAERVTEVEILAALRSQGVADLSDVEAVVLETDGTLSAVKGEGASLRNVRTLSSPTA
ncbi:DUF421 domain-containing protein [Arenibaculum sp.]|jgi:uncharacterized membrane protein YcaP (DUF421 family)|uniref:DUF421 domain-containing protein n=1 Tax=Arenibaculum sp. TaxID=2865862 RepID=UPI002E0E8985|nr:YetF domain-containing protein [Arenibaculum sp.]